MSLRNRLKRLERNLRHPEPPAAPERPPSLTAADVAAAAALLGEGPIPEPGPGVDALEYARILYDLLPYREQIQDLAAGRLGLQT